MSNKKCCVPGCPHSSGTGENLHKFPNPTKNKELFNTWLYSIGGDILPLENDHIFKYRRVCHVHFEEKYWCRNNRLSNVAVPTKNMPGLSSTKFFSHERRILRSIQSSEPSTSKEPAALQLSTHSTVEDVPMKENLCPEAESSQLESVALQLQNISGGETPTKRKYSDPGTVTIQMDSASTSVQNLSDVRCVKIRENLGYRITKRKHQKHVAVTKAEHNLHTKLIRIGVRLSKCRSKAKKQAAKIKALQNITNNPQFLQTLDNLSSTAKILTLLQFREHKKGNKGRRFKLKEKIVALSIMKQSPKGYRFLRKIFILPSRQTLLKLLNNADINPGINKSTIEQIKKATEKMKLEHKLCIVLFDEMSLKPNVTYNERRDKVTGFVTDGHRIQCEYADHAQVFMIRGLIKNYKQPISYSFSQSATKGPELAKQLKDVISSLQEAGLIVVATVCDQGTNNVHCIKSLVQESRGILLRKGEEPRENIIIINDQEIIPLYDPPHLIKCIRNNLITKNLQYLKDGNTKVAKWSHITKLHNENPGYRGIRLVPKLTDAHCDPSKIPRMKVKNATQLFSQTVASNMGYLAEAKDTADVLLIFDRLFDSMNGSFGKRRKHGKPLLGPATPTSIHHDVWNESKIFLKQMKFTNPSTSQNEHVPTLSNWVWTIEGVEVLLKKLKNKYDIKSVWLRHLNQDPIENFFGSIRSHGCRNVNPTPERFESAFATLLVNSLSGVHAPGANCQADNCYALHEVLMTGGGSKELDNCELQHIPIITITPLEEKNDPRKIGGLQYVSGYFVKNAKQKVFKGCKKCKTDLLSSDHHEYLRYREYANKKWLCSPSDSLLNCVSQLQDINYAILKENLNKNCLKNLITTITLMHIDFEFLKCAMHKEKLINFIIKISSRFFIYNYCKEINKILTNKRACDDDTDLFKVKAKKLYKKCFKRKNKY